MNKRDRYITNFVVIDEVVMEISDNDKDKLIERATGFLESAFNAAICSIKNTQTDTVAQTRKLSPTE